MSLEPFTVEHFQRWASRLVLDNEEPWVLEPFQLEFARDVFAGVPACWLIVPEGNGKTTFTAGLFLYHLKFRPEASIPIAASSRQQAMILYGQAEGFVYRSPALALEIAPTLKDPGWRCQEGYRRIKYGRGIMQVFAADDSHADGVIPTMCGVEELHRHKDLRLYDTWRGKSNKRQGQTIVISTAGEPGSQFEERRAQIRARAGDVRRDGSFGRYATDQLVLHEYALLEGEDPEDLEAVKRANPFSGITVGSLTEKFQAPDFNLGHWRRFTCNLPTRGDMAAIQEKEWFDAIDEDGIPAGDPVAVGLDLGWKYDTTAAVPLWSRDTDVRILGAASLVVPPRDGTSVDPDQIKRLLAGIHERNPIEKVCMDPSDGRDVALWLEDELGCLVVEMSQRIPQKVKNYSRFMEGLRGGTLKHSGDPGLTSHALNAVARILPGGDLCFARPVKRSQARSELQDVRVIDALDAASMVYADAVEMAEPAGDLVLL
jgi:phage terminase large subunit-like protein